jgi:hypothetical protein
MMIEDNKRFVGNYENALSDKMKPKSGIPYWVFISVASIGGAIAAIPFL